MRGVAVVACGERVVAGFLPGVVLLAHDVAIDAGRRIIGHVRGAVGDIKGEAARADEDADDDAKGEAGQADRALALTRGHGADMVTGKGESFAQRAPSRLPRR